MGIGVVIRDEEKVLSRVWAQSLPRSSCVSEGEGLALLQGMKCAQQEMFQSVIVETDSSEVYKALCLGLGISEWCMSWLDEASWLLEKNFTWSVSLIGRGSNGMADCLARNARQESWCWVDCLAVPGCVASFV
ncbi:hypothetical protein QQ045_033699 [Rhodiola kirilowii]